MTVNESLFVLIWCHFMCQWKLIQLHQTIVLIIFHKQFQSPLGIAWQELFLHYLSHLWPMREHIKWGESHSLSQSFHPVIPLDWRSALIPFAACRTVRLGCKNSLNKPRNQPPRLRSDLWLPAHFSISQSYCWSCARNYSFMAKLLIIIIVFL